MLKTIARILIILLVAALVAGGLYALIQNTGANTPGFTERSRSFAPQTGASGSQQPGGFREHDREGGASLGRGLGGILISLLQIGVIVFIVVQARNVLSVSRRSKLSEPT
jgi:hypothetical protein